MIQVNRNGLIILLVLLFTFCQTKSESQEEVPEEIQGISSKKSEMNFSASPNSEIWPGTYSGTIPCDHCEGITIWLTLTQNESFELKTSYLGLNDARDEIFTGKFIWENGKSSISLQGLIGGYPGKFKLEGDQVWYLDENGKFYEGKNSNNYLLKKKW
jgi:hypothetical protein